MKNLRTMHRQTWIWLVALAVLFSVTGSKQLWAQQSTGEVLGTVTDPTGAVVPNATATLTNTGTNDVKTLTTGGAGAFDFANLNPGNYKLVITGAGFSTVDSGAFVVSAGDRRRLDTQMKLGASTTTVEVSTVANAALQTDSSTMQNTITTESVAALPLNGRNYINLVQITPGATEGGPSTGGAGGAPDDRRQSSNVSLNSQSDSLNNNMIDGLDNNERIIGTVGVRPTIESIQEVKILTNTFTADSGRAAGAVINIITKSGTNNFHGSLYEYFRNDKLNAYAYQFGQQNPKPELRQNQFGGSIGGPIFKNRTFFFGDADFFRVAQHRTPPGIATVPSAYEQAHPGDFSDVGNATTGNFNSNGTSQFCNGLTGAPILDPAGYKVGCAYNPATGLQYAGNIIPTGSIDPVGLNYFKLYSLPNGSTTPATGTATYSGMNKRYQYQTNYDVRLDHKISASNAIFARYSVNDVFTVTPSPALPPKVVAGLLIDGQNDVDGYSPQLDRNIQLNFNHTFTPNLVMLLGAGWTFIQNFSYPPNYGLNPNTAFGEPGINYNAACCSALGGVTFNAGGVSGFGAGRPGFVPLLTKDNTYQINGAIFYNLGRQSLKAGAALIRRHANNFQETNGMGNIGFTNGAPGLLTGAFSSAVRINNPFGPTLYRVWEPSVFLQDDWRVSQKLTLNLGIRWDMFTPFVEKNNHIANWLWDKGQVVAGVNGANRSAGVNLTTTNYQPRVGFAFNPHTGTVLRGGFGLASFVTTQQSPASMKVQPWAVTFGTCSAATCPLGFNALRKGLPIPGSIPAASLDLDCGGSVQPAAGVPCAPQAIPSSLPQNFRDSYSEQWNLTVQQELPFKNVLTVAYVGVRGRHLSFGLANANIIPLGYYRDANVPLTPGQPGIVVNVPGGPAGPLSPGTLKGRRFNEAPPFARNTTQIQAVISEGASNYNGLQATLARRFENGLGYTATTAWAHNLDNVAGNGLGGMSTVITLDPSSPYYIGHYDYSDGALDQRNRFVFQGNYSPRFTKGLHGVAKQVFDGWQGNVISIWTTGLPVDVTNGNNLSLTSPGQNDRPNRAGNPFQNVPTNAPAGQIQYFNPAVFSNGTNTTTTTGQTIVAPRQLLGTVGNSRRNPMHAPPAQHVDFGLGKAFPIHEQVRLNFKAEGFNMLNSVIFASPAGGVTGGTFGRITSARSDYLPRVFQFALRVEF
jgi:hypothetical protein